HQVMQMVWGTKWSRRTQTSLPPILVGIRGLPLPCPYSNSQSAPMRNDNNAPPGALEPTIRLSGGNSSNTPETDADTLPLRETKCALSGVLSVRNFCNNRSDSSNRSVSKMPRSL